MVAACKRERDDEVRAALEAVVRDDPNDDVREGAGRLLRGQPLAD